MGETWAHLLLPAPASSSTEDSEKNNKIKLVQEVANSGEIYGVCFEIRIFFFPVVLLRKIPSLLISA